MRQSAWNECKQALRDYRRYEWYIRELEQGILNPWTPADLNQGITGSRKSADDSMVNTIVRLNEDQALRRVKFYKSTIENLFETNPDWLVELIKTMYCKNDLVKLRPASELVGVGYRRAKEGHNQFMEDLARDLGILTF